MKAPLMPKATAVWLIENTTLTFEQIAEFCHLHVLEVQAIADGDIAVGMVGQDPVVGGQLTYDEIERCQADSTQRLQMRKVEVPGPTRKARYTPLAKRHFKPDAIAWLLKECPSMTDTDIIRLVGTTKATIGAIRGRTHRLMNEIKPQHPVLLGLCSRAELENMLVKYQDRTQTKE